MNKFVIGDIHGAYLALLQVLKDSNFNYFQDQLICLGDACDRLPQTNDVIDELLKIKNLIFILGNHDLWTFEWMQSGKMIDNHYKQGGYATLISYKNKKIPKSHVSFYKQGKGYYIDEKDRLFVHGGFNPRIKIENQSIEYLAWDRQLFNNFIEGCITSIGTYSEVFIGHTPTPKYKKDFTPLNIGNLWNLDQGAGYGGKLTLMNIETKGYWQSDFVDNLYRKFSP